MDCQKVHQRINQGLANKSTYKKIRISRIKEQKCKIPLLDIGNKDPFITINELLPAKKALYLYQKSLSNDEFSQDRNSKLSDSSLSLFARIEEFSKDSHAKFIIATMSYNELFSLQKQFNRSLSEQISILKNGKNRRNPTILPTNLAPSISLLVTALFTEYMDSIKNRFTNSELLSLYASMLNKYQKVIINHKLADNVTAYIQNYIRNIPDDISLISNKEIDHIKFLIKESKLDEDDIFYNPQGLVKALAKNNTRLNSILLELASKKNTKNYQIILATKDNINSFILVRILKKLGKDHSFREILSILSTSKQKNNYYYNYLKSLLSPKPEELFKNHKSWESFKTYANSLSGELSLVKQSLGFKKRSKLAIQLYLATHGEKL